MPDNERYSTQCENCKNWKYGCWKLAPGTIAQVKKCDIYTAHRAQVSQNWQALGIRAS